MSNNVFAVLNESKKKAGKRINGANVAAVAPSPSLMDTSTTENKRWGDDSDDEVKQFDSVPESTLEDECASESQSDEDSEDSEEVEEKVESVATKEKAKSKDSVKKLSKKELKEREMQELESAFADFGIPAVKETTNEPNDEQPTAAPIPLASDVLSNQDNEKKKAKKKKKKAQSMNKEPAADTKTVGVTDIKSVIKSKGKKKKPEESAAVKIAREEALKGKSKKKPRDKSAFNEFSI